MSTSLSVRDHHGHDESWHPSSPPDAVCFVESVEEIAAILKVCNREHVPVIPFGTGTGMEGQVNAIEGGVSIDVSGMNQILRVSQEDMDCTVQAGVTRLTLNTYLRDSGLFFPVDPGADASFGGMAATRASGTNAVRYGTMRENILSLKIVTPDGRIIETGTRARKSAAAYDLTHLYVGSEGTLGVIAEVTLRLQGIPEAISAARVNFPDVETAVDAVILTIQSNIPVARIELLDDAQMDAINRYSKTDYPVQTTLFVEFHGTDASVREQATSFGDICSEFGGHNFEWTANTEDRSRMWQARHDAAYAAMALRPEGRALATDVSVPISALAECIRAARADIAADGRLSTMLAGHVGDGNFHMIFMIDPDDPEELAAMKTINDRIIHHALRLGGTCTGEHGIGMGKQAALREEMGDDAIDLMWAIKSAIDPNNIMNPGKKLPPRNP